MTIFWDIIVIFFMVMYLMFLFYVITDLFRNHEMSGGVKVLWFLALLIFPGLALLIYLLVEGRGMAERNMRAQRDMQKAQENYIRQVASAPASDSDPAEQIRKAHDLLQAGAISQAEFDAIKAKALSA